MLRRICCLFCAALLPVSLGALTIREFFPPVMPSEYTVEGEASLALTDGEQEPQAMPLTAEGTISYTETAAGFDISYAILLNTPPDPEDEEPSEPLAMTAIFNYGHTPGEGYTIIAATMLLEGQPFAGGTFVEPAFVFGDDVAMDETREIGGPLEEEGSSVTGSLRFNGAETVEVPVGTFETLVLELDLTFVTALFTGDVAVISYLGRDMGEARITIESTVTIEDEDLGNLQLLLAATVDNTTPDMAFPQLPVAYAFDGSPPLGEGWKWCPWWDGAINDTFWPWVLASNKSDWLYVLPGGLPDLYVYDLTRGTWLYTRAAWFPAVYNFAVGGWGTLGIDF